MSDPNPYPLIIGDEYQNRKWKFKVLSIDGDQMCIRTQTAKRKSRRARNKQNFFVQFSGIARMR